MIFKAFKFVVIVVLMMLILLMPDAVEGEDKAPQLDGKMRRAVIASVNEKLVEKYIFLDVAEKIAAHLDSKLKKGEYDKLTDASEFCRTLTRDIRSINNDRHLWIAYDPKRAEELRKHESESEEEKKKVRARYIERRRRGNFGFEKVERLPGNVGLLQLSGFVPTEIAGDTAAAAMAFLANSDAVIIDLRTSGGGSPSMVQMLCTYFVEESTHINSFENRSAEKKLQQFWTFPYVPGKRMPDTDLYVLTSRRVFSAAEEFTYDLKHMKRATIVGETTGGGAHPGGTFVIQKDYVMFISTGRAVNPITNTNWEGAGIEPHVKVAAEKALDTAHLMALEKLAKKAEDEEQKSRLDWVISGIKAKLNPVEVDEEILKKYAGEYEGNRIVTFADGQLLYKRATFKSLLVPMSQTLFGLEGIDYARVEFITDKHGAVTGATVSYDDGTKRFLKKIK